MGKPLVIHVTTIGITSYRALLAQCRYFSQRGLEVGFVFSPSPETDRLRSLGFPVKEIDIDRKINPWADLKAIVKLAKYFKQTCPDIVHTHTSKAGVVGRIAAKLAGVPNVFHTVHGFPFQAGMPKAKYRLYLQIEKWMSGITDVMLSQSSEDVVTAVNLGIRARRGELLPIGNGVDLGEFNPGEYSQQHKESIRSRLSIKSTEPVITMIGRINREKGYDDLVDALQKVRDLSWQALFIGPDEGHLAGLRHKIKQYGLSCRIQFLGQRNDIADLLAVSDIYTLPSYREGLPRSLIEAQAMSLPCVATDIRGCREVIEEGVTGFLFHVGDCGTLSDRLRRLLLDPELRFQMGEAGRRRMKSHFDEADVGRKVMSYYAQALNKTDKEYAKDVST